LAYLGAALERAGIEARVLDLVVFPYSKALLEETLNDFRPDAVGATCVTMSYNHAAAVLKDVKAIAPDLPTVLGGPHVTFYARETMAALPELDFIVRGEGEEAIVELARAVENGRGFDRVKGLVYREGGRVVEAEPRLPGIDADALPIPARHLLPMGRYRALGLATSMTTSRGCPFKCIFCVGRQMVGAKVRYRDPVKVVDEMEYLVSLKFPQINVADDLFTANKKHCLGVCDEIGRRGLEVKWTSFARVDTVSPEVLRAMKQAGCTAVSFGVESGVPSILKTIRKGITLDQVVEAAKMCIDAGVLPHASFILGLPGETKETVAQTVAFGEKLKALGVSHGFHLLAPFPGTEVRDRAADYGLRILSDDWSEYHANRAIVETAEVSADELNAVAIEWERLFDEYLGYLKKRMESGEASAEEAWPLVNLERIVADYDLMMARTIEAEGTWPAEAGASPAKALEELIRRAAKASGKDEAKVRDALTDAAGKDNLVLESSNGAVKWRWRDYL
jgi:radical SAM superfamily enzyme YgiQ (UPF0313 family)